MTVLISGASGFVGEHLVSLLSDKKYDLRLGLREAVDREAIHKKGVAIKFDLGNRNTDYGELLRDVDVVIHLAGIAHRKSVSDDVYRRINVEGTARLASAAAAHGVKRFVFLSTIKVYGETNPEVDGVMKDITETTATNPQDRYSQSKLEAEQAVILACNNNAMEYVILRPPLVYGPGVKANFLKLLGLVYRNIPLPFASIHNHRSLIYVENLCDLINNCIDHKAVANRTYVLKDYDISTPGLILSLSQLFNKHARIFACPHYLLRLASQLIDQGAAMGSLINSLYVDDSALRISLGWHPLIDKDTGLKKTINWYMSKYVN